MSKHPLSYAGVSSKLLLFLLALGLSLGSISTSLAAPPSPEDKTSVSIDTPPEVRTVPAGLRLGQQVAKNPKLDSVLAELAATASISATAVAEFAQARSLRLAGNRVQIQIVTHPAGLAKVTRAVTAAGGEVTGTGYDQSSLQGWLPPDALVPLTAQPDVYFIRRPLPLFPLENLRVGNSTTEGLAVINGPAWHTAGQQGAGIKIGIIDLGFTGYPGLLGVDLPATVVVKNFVDGEGEAEVNGTTEHGAACAEVIHDIAPGAELYLAKAGTDLDLAEAALWLISQEVDIISTSLGLYNASPGDGAGWLADLVSQARSEGILWVTAAGNDREAHWGGLYLDTDGNNFHEFSTAEEVNCFVFTEGACAPLVLGQINIFMRWNDWANVDQDYDLHLVRWTGTTWEVVASSTNPQTGDPGQTPTEAISIPVFDINSYGFVIERVSGNRPVNFEIFTPQLLLLRPDQILHERSIANLADAPDALTVAALNVVSPHDQEFYSSEGPTNGPGGSETGGSIKPDLAGLANVSTQSYGPGVFNGTSAATPHVAGAAALVLSAHSTYTPAQLQAFLTERAIDMGESGLDTRFGYGRLFLGDPPTATNTPPTLTGLPDLTVPLNGSADNALDLWTYASDAEDATAALTFTISNSPPLSAGVTIDANRYIDVNPTLTWTGTISIEVQVQDTGGLTATDIFSVTIKDGVNTAPILTSLPDLTVPLNGSADNALDLWAYVSDIEDAPAALTFTISNSPPISAGVTIDSNRYVDIMPMPAWTGTAHVDVLVQDTGGLTATGSFSVTTVSENTSTYSIYLPLVLK